MAYSQADIRIMAYSQGHICIHCIPKRTFASWHTLKKHLHQDVPNKRHLHHETFRISILARRHLHSLHTQAGIRIHCILTRGICIMACINGTFATWDTPKRTFASWHAPWEHSHHGIRTCSQADIHIMAYPQGSIYIMTYLHEYLHHDIPT